ncbi:hypothetical protein [Sporosarcina sp. USHLN248]|uniref:hypothetical protein n=1 Tax=Sporosarcina sp. USHLN248 TaxID=3081300 RepID=UPI003016F6C6
MAVRKGRFAIWKGKEYPIVSQQRTLYLQSDYEDEINGFKKWSTNSDTAYKEVSVEDLDDAYEIFPYVMLSGYRFVVDTFHEKDGKVTLTTNNPFVQKKLSVTPYGRDEFRIVLPIEEVEILEDRLPILGFDE